MTTTPVPLLLATVLPWPASVPPTMLLCDSRRMPLLALPMGVVPSAPTPMRLLWITAPDELDPAYNP